MNNKILVTRPSYDDATSYCFYYAGLIIKEAENKGINVYDLKNPNLTQKSFAKVMEEKSPLFVFFNSHGDEKTVYGDKVEGEEEVLVQEGKNHHLLDSKLVYSRTCLSASSLGKACTGGCFIGYNMPFSFYVDDNWSTKPANDSTAKIFFEPSNIIDSSIIKGNTASSPFNKSLPISPKKIIA